MGTRADFYIGKGKDGEWLGSIAWDGYRDGIVGYILKAKTEANFRKAVEVFLQKRDDATFPKDGWPWPWNDSGTTDCSYWFFEGKCWEAYGYPREFYIPCDKDIPSFEDDEAKEREWLQSHEPVVFPDMSARKNVTLGKRSGVIVIGA
jgi:hypothetical protein